MVGLISADKRKSGYSVIQGDEGEKSVCLDQALGLLRETGKTDSLGFSAVICAVFVFPWLSKFATRKCCIPAFAIQNWTWLLQCVSCWCLPCRDHSPVSWSWAAPAPPELQLPCLEGSAMAGCAPGEDETQKSTPESHTSVISPVCSSARRDLSFPFVQINYLQIQASPAHKKTHQRK